MTIHFRLLAGIVLFAGLSLKISAAPFSDFSSEQTEQVKHVSAQLVAESESITPGKPVMVGLKLSIEPHWHVNWLNPGDAGLPPKITWSLPEGFAAGEILWPYPRRLPYAPLMGFGYHDSVLFPILLSVPQTITGSSITLKAHAEWLVCNMECVPEEQDIELTLSVNNSGTDQPSPLVREFETAIKEIPVTPNNWRFTTVMDDTLIRVTLTPLTDYHPVFTDLFLFPFDQGIIENAEPQQVITNDDGSYTILVTRNRMVHESPDKFQVAIVADRSWLADADSKAIQVTLTTHPEQATTAAAASTGGGVSSIWLALLLAFVGGLILNLMPCVLPVLSLKVLGIVKSAHHESRSAVIRHGMLFTIGVLISFWILAGLLILLQAGGEQLGWGFQLQSPAFIVVLASVFFLFGLNLLGVFEIGTSLTAVGQQTSNSSGNVGAFMNGVLATVVATPCTAPFMGSALGYSLSQPAFISLLIFTAIGLGMAAPYLLISFLPNLAKVLPKPGRWMETLKQVMGFFLLATVIWLIWVLSIQIESLYVALFLGCLLVLGIAAWVLGRWGTLAVATGKRRFASAISIILILVAVGSGIYISNSAGGAVASTRDESGTIAWQPFSESELIRLTQASKPVFVDFTAAWCLSCKVNERVALHNQEVTDQFNRLGIVTMKADWTNRDEAIARTLAKYGRNSVPLYLLFAGNGAEPVVLPEILTPGIVLEALNGIANNENAYSEISDNSNSLEEVNTP